MSPQETCIAELHIGRQESGRGGGGGRERGKGEGGEGEGERGRGEGEREGGEAMGEGQGRGEGEMREKRVHVGNSWQLLTQTMYLHTQTCLPGYVMLVIRCSWHPETLQVNTV